MKAGRNHPSGWRVGWLMSHERRLGSLGFILSLATAAGCVPAAQAAPPHPILVELYTSQGCSSCPPADAFVRDLPRLGFGRERVVPLTFHVDYWDDLGWKDPFASPAFSERQRAYARAGRLVSPDGGAGIHGSYTPQMIVGGRVHFSGGRRDLALAELRRAEALPVVATLQGEAVADRESAMVTLRLSTQVDAATMRSWQVRVALAAKSARTSVLHGENGGETLEEAAVVRWLSDGLTVGADSLRVAVPRPRGMNWDACELVAFVQTGATGPVVAVRALPLAPG
jgi:hypothetical protein